jgi:hypothetical protein
MTRANRNAKEELLETINIISGIVKCAEIRYSACCLWEMNDETPPPSKEIVLKVGYNETEWEEFLDALDFEYDGGYGGQELFGIVWFSASDKWMEREEYDGSEWWRIMGRPEIPENLIK